MSKDVTLESLKAHGIDVDGAVVELKAIVAKHAATHKTIGRGEGPAPELTDGQVRSVVRRYFTAADTEAAFEAAVEAVKAKLK